MGLLKKALLTLIGLGIALGIAQYLGDGAPLLSTDWFHAATNKFESLQDFGSTTWDELVPDPETVAPDLNLNEKDDNR